MTIRALGDLGVWGSGGTPLATRPEYYGGDIPWITIEDLNDGRVERSLRSITPLGLNESSSKIVPVGTILIAMYGSIGKLGIAGIRCATNQAIAWLQPNATAGDPTFLFHLLLAHRGRLMRAGRGGTQQNISQEFLKAYEVDLPPLPEQRRISAQLAEADRLRRMRRYALELSDTLLPAAFSRMFGNPVTNPCGWPISTIGDQLSSSDYGTSQRSSDNGFGYRMLGMSNITFDGALDLSAVSRVELTPKEFQPLRLLPGDIIYNRTNSTELVGKTACWESEQDAVLASYLVRLRLREALLPRFFVALLNSPYFKKVFQSRCKRAVGQSNFSPTLLRELPLYVPPITLQQDYASLVAQHERLRAQQREALRQAEHLFQTLLHRAFS